MAVYGQPFVLRINQQQEHAQFLEDDVFERLKAQNLALCVADSEKLSTPSRITADFAYFRLRDEGYRPDDIARWAETIRRETVSCRDVYVYFKHEDEGKGPELATLLRERLGAGPAAPLFVKG